MHFVAAAIQFGILCILADQAKRRGWNMKGKRLNIAAGLLMFGILGNLVAGGIDLISPRTEVADAAQPNAQKAEAEAAPAAADEPNVAKCTSKQTFHDNVAFMMQLGHRTDANADYLQAAAAMQAYMIDTKVAPPPCPSFADAYAEFDEQIRKTGSYRVLVH